MNKNWWITVYNNYDHIVEEWLIKHCTEVEALKKADVAFDNMSIVDLGNGRYISTWSLREAIVTVDIQSGHVEISGLPDGWGYELVDHDMEGCGE